MIRIGFFGTPEIASCCLEGLMGRYHIAFVVAGEDKPAGRHQKMTLCPAQEAALCSDVPVIQPARLRDPEAVSMINGYGADIYVVVAYGKIIPREIFDHPRLKTINLHPSLLPKYRGAAPIPWALIRGEEKTGVSVQLINEDLDAGDVLLQESIGLDPDLNAGDLYEIVESMAPRLLSQAIDLLDSGRAMPVPQNHEEATYCGKITRELACIDWSRSSREIHNLVRGLNPKPVAWTHFRGKNIKIWRTAPVSETIPGLGPGEAAVLGKKRLVAGTGDGCIEIISIQPEAKKIMDGISFINGYRIEKGERFCV